MRKISTLVVSVLCMMMPVGAEAQVPTAFVSKGATDIQAQPHTITQTNSGAQWAPIDPMVRSITMDDGLPSNAVRSVVQGSKGYMWFGTDNGLCRFDGYDVKTYYNPFTTVDQFVSALTACEEGLLVGCNNGAYLFCNATDRFQKLSDKITAPVLNFSLDGDQNIWISTNGQGVFRYNRTTHELHQYPMKNIQGKVQSTLVDANNQVWMLCNHGEASIYHLNKSTDQFEAFPLKGDATMFYGMAMLAAPDGNLYVGTWENGLYKLNADGSAEQLISGTLSNAVHHIHQLYNNSNKYILIASDDGLVQYDIQNRSWSMLSEVNDPSRSTNERFVYGIAGDNEGGIWVTTFYGGVSYLPSTSVEERFRAYSARQGGLRGNVVGRFFEDQQHRIWIATDDAGLDCFNPQTNSFVSYPGKAAMGKYNVHALFANGNDLWVGTYGNGVIRMNMATGAQQIFQTDGMASGSNAYCIYRDRKNRLWAASMDGASLFDEVQQKFSKIKSFKSLTIDIKEDPQGNVWFATQGGGLWRLDKNNVWKQYKHVENDSNSLVSDQVNCLVIGEKGQLYAATGDGLCEFLPSKGVFRRISIEAPSQDFASLVISQGVMWISTSKGIVKYTPGEPVQLFNKYDGLTCDQFMPNAGLLASDGRIYFGSTRGFNCFYPYLVKINQVAPPVAITSVELFGQPIEAGSDQLEKSLSHAAELNLSHNENTINISFAALSYVSPEKNQYAYKLEGVDKDWIYTHEHRANYTNLPAGTYTFLVKATNNDGVWSKNEARLQIVVHPPFWWSLPAKILYLLLIGYAIYWFMQSRLKREKLRHQEELDQLELKQDQEMRDARLQFFTMIAHEIRTPVTLIIGPLESLKEHWKQVSGKLTDGETITQTLSVIDRNAQRLLLLVNQLLDFNKVQQKGMQVHFHLNNISKLMHAVAERFAPTFEQKSIRFDVDYPADDLVAMIDQEAITKVISNLMTNALKYTGDYVHLSCRLLENGTHFRIEVEDNGLGISPDEKEKIFGAFYQARDNKPGTGIGLNIVKNLVEAHHGMVEVESAVGKGSTFIVTLPLNQVDAVVEKADEMVKDEEVDAEENLLTDETPVEQGSQKAGVAVASPLREPAKPVMLIVDDDEDMRQFVKAHFEKMYTVYTADNGKNALRKLEKHPVSLIISDWMMPEMDGPEFCRRVRENSEYSHLPFVMLTAKTDDAAKTESMNCGADVYIEKPFSMKYLEASVRQLLEMRRLLRSKFSHTPLEPIAEIASTQVDNAFLERMSRIIEENVANPELNVAFLAEKMGMSRSSLFNKIRGLADVTPNEMIQLVKLKKGAKLLKEGNYRISEISYMVGFSSPSYFAKCFQKQFGVKPMDFVAAES